MPDSSWVARANKRYVNPVATSVAAWAPGWAIVIHRGRKSGHIFRTPLWAFQRPGGFIIALTNGPNADWVRNVLADNGCEMLSRRHRYLLTAPRLCRDEMGAQLPSMMRFVVRNLIDAPTMLSLDVERRLF